MIGAFIGGAPVLARELETGTFRFAWTRGIRRLRWTFGKLVPLAIAVTAVAGAFTVLFAWYNQPWVAAGYVSPFSARVFGLLGVALAAWTLAAFAIGVLAGMVIRRAVPRDRRRHPGRLRRGSPSPPGCGCASTTYRRWSPAAQSRPARRGSSASWSTKGGTFAFGDHGNAG